MDAISQIQTYLKAMSACFADTLRDVEMKSVPVPLESDLDTDTQRLELKIAQEAQNARLDERAQEILCMYMEAKILIESLPTNFESEAEQLQIIADLEAENIRVINEVKEAESDAKLWYDLISKKVKNSTL